MIIDQLPVLPSDPETGDEIPIERGENSYKVDYDDLAQTILSGAVIGVKGNAESTYRSSRVNLTPANIGAFGNNSISGNITDANDYTLYGARFLNGSDCSHLPNNSGYFELICMGSVQIAIQYNGNDPSVLWKRYYLNDQWYSWANVESTLAGVKGDAESSYRTGNVNLTPVNIGALATSGGTMTGSISMGQSGASTTSQNIVLRTENKTGFYIRTYNNQLQIARQPSGGSSVTVLNLYADGSIGFGSPSAWRSALGIVLASGSQTFSSLAAGLQTNASISFSQSIGTSNYIVVTQPNVARCAVGVQSKTANGFEMYCRNVSPDTSSPIIGWAAIALG